MSTTQQNWLNANAARAYPLDDTATGTDDNGQQLPSDVISDMHIRWPLEYGRYAFIGGVTVTRQLVTVVIIAADSPTAASEFKPLACITVMQPATEYAVHNLQPMADGVGGFIVFGDLSENCSSRFSSPTQSLLTPKCARAYDTLPVKSIRKQGRNDKLVDIVTLLGENDVEAVTGTREIDGEIKDVIILRLRNATSGSNPLVTYVGPCGNRPESNTCDQPGIQSINGIQPDCNGNINIDFKSLIAASYADCGVPFSGTTLDQTLTLADVCPAKKVIRFLGKDFCNGGASLSLPYHGQDPGTGGGEPVIPSGSSLGSAVPCRDLPFQDCFDATIDASWITKVGSFRLVDETRYDNYPCPEQNCVPARGGSVFGTVFTTSGGFDIWNGVFDVAATSGASVFGDVFNAIDGSDIWAGVFDTATSGGPENCTDLVPQSVQLSDLAKRNIVIWEDCATGSAVNKKVKTHLQLLEGSSQNNAGLVLNYRTVDPYTNPRINFMLAQIDKNANKLQLQRYNGTTMISENAITPPVPFVMNDWYELEVTIVPIGNAVMITMAVSNVSAPDWPPTTLSLLTNLWGTSDGYFGLHTLKSAANFSFWRIEDV